MLQTCDYEMKNNKICMTENKSSNDRPFPQPSQFPTVSYKKEDEVDENLTIPEINPLQLCSPEILEWP